MNSKKREEMIRAFVRVMEPRFKEQIHTEKQHCQVQGPPNWFECDDDYFSTLKIQSSIEKIRRVEKFTKKNVNPLKRKLAAMLDNRKTSKRVTIQCGLMVDPKCDQLAAEIQTYRRGPFIWDRIRLKQEQEMKQRAENPLENLDQLKETETEEDGYVTHRLDCIDNLEFFLETTLNLEDLRSFAKDKKNLEKLRRSSMIHGRPLLFGKGFLDNAYPLQEKDKILLIFKHKVDKKFQVVMIVDYSQ